MLQSFKTKQTNNKKNIAPDVNVTFTSTKLKKSYTSKVHRHSEKKDVKADQKHYYSSSRNYYPDGNAGNYQGL
jgi:hypothetical protein